MAAVRKKIDKAIEIIARFADKYEPKSKTAFDTAWLCLLDSMACAILSLKHPECQKLLGVPFPGMEIQEGARVIGTKYVLDPINAAFNLGTMIRFLDFNDTYLGKEWGHPSDNLGGLIAVADYLDRNGKKITIRDFLKYMIKAYEIQGILSEENSFNKIGFDHVVFVRVATAAIATKMLGGNFDQIVSAVSNAFVDASPLRLYRHAPNVGFRKSWAAGDATARGVFLASLALKGEGGYPLTLSAKKWGLYDVLFKGRPFTFSRRPGSKVIENILFKPDFPAEFHAQTAVEAVLILHPDVQSRLKDIEKIEIYTQKPAMDIINKTGSLNNPADRDHCLQYMVAAALLFGELSYDHYDDKIAKDKRLDFLRSKMLVKEDKKYSRNYYSKGTCANRITIFLKGGGKIGPIEVEYPLGHKKRRKEAIPYLAKKLQKNLMQYFDKKRVDNIQCSLKRVGYFEKTRISNFLNLFNNESSK